jgi:CRISPR system Cascade subunit CasA
MMLGNGFDYPAFDGKGIPAEPSATVTLSKKGEDRAVLGAGDKAIWRELSALIVRRKQNRIGGPLTLRNIPEDQDFDIWVGAFLTSKASIEDTVESVLHVPAAMQNPIGRGAYDDEVQYSESVASRLGWAVETWREYEDGGWKGRVETTKPQDRWKLKEKLRGIATKHFWTSVEKLRPLLLAHIETLGTTAEAVEQSQARWRKAVWAAAFDAYRLACGQETPRQIRAYALGLSRLTGESSKGEENAEQEPETTEA